MLLALLSAWNLGLWWLWGAFKISCSSSLSATSTVDKDRLALDGYTVLSSNHPQSIKRDGVGLYVKEALPSTNRSDFVTLPECLVCEIKLNRKKILFCRNL